MQSNFGRVAVGALAVIVAVVLLIVLKDDGSDETSSTILNGAVSNAESRPDRRQPAKPEEPAIAMIAVKNGKPVGGVRELTFEAGEQIRFVVRSNKPDEVHVHGYDVEKEIPPGRPVLVAFPATIEGIFEAELHGSGEQVAELRIVP